MPRKQEEKRTATCVAMLLALVATGVTVGTARAQETAPSFDCAAATGEVETLICADAALAALDRRLAEIWAAAIERWPAEIVTEQRAYQRGWISGRNECWKADDVRSCVELAYRTRIVELQISSGQLMAPDPVGYTCEGHEGEPVWVTFYGKTDPPSAVVTVGADQVIAFLAPAASGARYTAANMEFWEHQGEASVDWYGTRLLCRPQRGA